MKLTRKQLRKLVIEALTETTVGSGDGIDLQTLVGNAREESGEYVPSAERDLSNLEEPASGWESHYGNLARRALGLVGKKYAEHDEIDGARFDKFWVDRIKEKEEENGNIVSWDDKSYAIKFENGYVWIVDEGIYHAMMALSLNTSWFSELDRRVQRHGPITDYSFDDYTITFKDAPYEWEIPTGAPSDYEGRN
jgi:hypothetical protein